jgi:hypothetical protein
MELPKVEYQTGSRFLLSMSVYFLTILFILGGFFYYRFFELSDFIKTVIIVTEFSLLYAFIVTLYRGIGLLSTEEKSRRARDAIERHILFGEYCIKCIEYNEKAKSYNKKYKTQLFPEKGALEYSIFLKEKDPDIINKLLKKNL